MNYRNIQILVCLRVLLPWYALFCISGCSDDSTPMSFRIPERMTLHVLFISSIGALNTKLCLNYIEEKKEYKQTLK